MIVVVEGISAAGKTRWCRRHAPGHIVREARPGPDVPDRAAEPEQAAAFWIEQNMRRWQLAVEMEARTGLAVCDSDPLKLHYSYGLWRIGVLAEKHWRLERELTRRAVSAGRLGLADLYLVKRIDAEQARRQRDADPNRSRRHFDLHVRLGPPLEAWYRAVETVLPGRVRWILPDDGVPAAPQRPREDDTRLFEALLERLG
jgi:hypothetical protein